MEATINHRISLSLETASGFVKDFQRCLEDLESPEKFRIFPLVKTEMYMVFSDMVNRPFFLDLVKRNDAWHSKRRDRGFRMVVREYDKI
jgi:hypothetical protein